MTPTPGPGASTSTLSPTRRDSAVLELTFGLMAAVYAPPSEALRADLASGAFAAAASRLADELGIPAPELGDDDWPAVQSAHVALFLTSADGVAAHPYVGYAADGELLGPTARALSAFYDSHALTPSPSWHDLPDHVAAVAEAGRLLAAAGRREAAAKLLARFVAPWFERYAAAVRAADDGPFYGPSTEFLSAVVEVLREDAA